MKYFSLSKDGGIATVTLSRDKVNALNEPFVEQISGCFKELEQDIGVKSIILSGEGKFFSFGFDIPEFLHYSRDSFTEYLIKFTDLYTYLFLFPKPIIAALNGHTIAGGCMLALACDYRIMVSGKAKISLNEIGFGSTVFAGCTEMLRFCVGNKNAEKILYSGAMYSAEEAYDLGLVDRVTTGEDLKIEAVQKSSQLGEKPSPAFASMKSLLRKSIVEEMKQREKESIREFVDIWYSDLTWENLKNTKIY